jgi:GAF domain-containing protein
MGGMGLLRRPRRDDIDVASCLANLSRLDAVAASGVLEPSRRERLDALTRRATHRLGAPMAFVSIFDDRWQHLAGATGADDELMASRRTSPEASYCQYVVALDDTLVVTDSTGDDLVRDHPATQDMGIRAYLGVPIRDDGQCLGSLCVVDTEARQWTDDDLAVLEQLAGEVLVASEG